MKDKKEKTALPLVVFGCIFIIVWFLMTFLALGDRKMERNLGSTPTIPGDSEHSTQRSFCKAAR